MPRARSLWAALVSCAAILFWNSVASAQADLPDTRSCEELTADWPLWSALSAHPWTRAEIDRKVFFSLDRLKIALHAAPLTAPVKLASNETEDYVQENPGRPGVEAYSAAAAFYGRGEFKKAVPLFDKIASDRGSDYRAPAAYTAARATLLMGDLAGAGARIEALAGDPALQEFAAQAYDLFSKIRYQSEAVPVNAAEISQISFMLTAPTEAVCASPLGEQLRRNFDGEFTELISLPLEYNRWNRFWIRTMASTPMASLDPVVEAAAFIETPWHYVTTFHGYGTVGWGDEPRPLDPASAALATLARGRWIAGHNPIWGAILAEHTRDQTDLEHIAEALAILRKWPGLPKAAEARYAWRLVAQVVRLKLMAGKIDEALAAASLLTPADFAADRGKPQPEIKQAEGTILASGIRWFAQRNDFESARRWALDGAEQFRLPIPNELKPLLVRNLGELYGDPRLGLPKVNGTVELGDLRLLFDLFSSRQLIEFSRRPDIASDDRRAFVAAAWARAYALEHWDDLVAWAPDLARAFPESEADIEPLEHAWFRGTVRHRAMLVMLRMPGLVILPSWARPPGGPEHWNSLGGAREADVRKFDSQNPSDGNWWCSPDGQEIAVDAAKDFVGMAVDTYWYHSELRDEVKEKDSDDAEHYFATFPLLKAADTSELEALDGVGSSTQRLAEAAVKWGNGITWFDRLLGRDRDVSEALARSVAATRYACRIPRENGPWSRAAYDLLHKNYPNSEWAKRTKYWFNTIQLSE